jgi:hypothetical protein
MELCLSREAVSRLATYEFPNILWKPKVPCIVHNNPPLVPNLSQINPVHISPPYLSKPYFNIIISPTFGSS